jgi:hypothetical protein
VYKVGIGKALGRVSKKLPSRVRKSGKAGYLIGSKVTRSGKPRVKLGTRSGKILPS